MVIFAVKKWSFFEKITKNGQFLSKMVILCPKLRKIVIVCQKIIQKLVFLGQFNAFLKKKLQKLSFLFNLMFVVVFF